ncbi:MAG: hypothetical protein RUDDFDWM_000276 [Candidatus Fervidibacterota bacterium]
MKSILIAGEIIILIGGLSLIFLFSLFEAALIASSRTRLQALLSQRTGADQVAYFDWAQSRQYIASFVIGCNVSILLTSALTTHLLVVLAYKKPLIQMIGTLAMITFILSVCEITPKTYSMQHAESVIIRWHRLIKLLGDILVPLTSALSSTAKALLHLLGYKEPHERLKLTDEEIMTLLEISVEEDVLQEREYNIASGIMRLDRILVKEVMVPRPDIVALSSDCQIEEVVNLIIKTGHSRIPIYETSIDNVIGIVYAYDILKCWSEKGRCAELKEIMRTPLFVPETKNLKELLNEMRSAQVHIAIVIDEYGSTAGLITLEDIAEQVVGELVDEHDKETPHIQQLDDGSYIVDATLNRYELKEKLKIELPDGKFDTLGGFIFYVLGRIPKVGESIKIEGAKLIVEEVKHRRVTKVRLVVDKTKGGEKA